MLTIWVLFLSTIAAIIVIGVDILYVRKVFFATNEYNALDSSEDAVPFWTSIFGEMGNLFKWRDQSNGNSPPPYKETSMSSFNVDKSNIQSQSEDLEPSTYIDSFSLDHDSAITTRAGDETIGSSGNIEHNFFTR